ncbi:MAG: carboxypeptidase regulatory-like domain-containing protein [Gemmatimonadaceae bacterium]|nr:carboxypeptidase regulatory-like domain-containing protein [Gemmatimonadaceae bacterium]
MTAPRFLALTADTSGATVEVDPTLVPRLSARVSMSGGRLPRRTALQILGRAAGVQFVYANDLIAADDSVSAPTEATTVLEALRAVIGSAPIDVVLTETANVVLVRRGTPVPRGLVASQRTRVASGPQSQAVRGVVQTEARAPVPATTVIVTMGPVRVSKNTTSDSTGHFAVRFDSATGDYLVYANAAGFKSVRKRVTVAPSDTGLYVEVTFTASTATQLDVVTVKAPIERPSAWSARNMVSGSQRRDVDGVKGALAPSAIGNIGETALTVPGTASTRDGVSVLGLPAGQNITTVDGAPFVGSGVPRSARVSQSVATSIWDPARGGFSGAEIETSIDNASPFETRKAYFSAMPAAAGVRPGAPPGGRNIGSVFAGSFLRSGEVWRDKVYAQIAADVTATTQSSASFMSASDAALTDAGVDPTVRRNVLANAAARGIPTRSPSTGGPRLMEGRLLARFDWGGYDYRRSQELPSSWYVTMLASRNGSENTATDVLRAPSTSSSSVGTRALIKIENSREVGEVARNVASAAVSSWSDRDEPLVRAPLAAVAAQATSEGVPDATILLGGSTRATTGRGSTTFELRDLLTWYVAGNPRNRIGLYAWSRVDQSVASTDGENPGILTFRSVSEFASQQPATYSRVLRSPRGAASTWNGALAVSENWRASPYLRIVGGVRVEGNALLSRPASNEAIQTTFGYRNNVAPTSLHVSPRLGISWTIDHSKYNTEGRLFSDLGQFALPTRSQLRLGVGEFRSLLLPAMALSSVRSTGLAGSSLTIQCTGTAVPQEDWAEWSTGLGLPARCRDGSGILADSSPAVSVLSRSFQPPRSWRATAGWTSSRGWLQYRLDAAWSWQRDQTGVYDLNFGNAGPVTVLASEGGRPLFTPLQAVDARTGLPAASQARRSRAFGSVDLLQAWRRGMTSAYTVSLANRTFRTTVLRTSYTFSSGWISSDGFDGPTTGDPRTAVRTPASVPRHMVIVEAGRTFAKGQLVVSGLARAQSGARYTPLVSQDINGDGRANDAAFVAGTPAEVASSLTFTPRGAERCLTNQAGRIAAIGSCEGPWQVTSNLMVAFSPRRTRASGLRWDSIVLNLSNPVGALDYALHGSSPRGWGANDWPDPVYLQVQGFDIGQRRYRYAVNPRFGASVAGMRALIAPVRLTLEVMVGLDPHPDLQQLRRAVRNWTENGKNVRPTVAEIVKKYHRQMPDPYKVIVEDPDSLFITPAQGERLISEQARYAARVDSVLTSMAEYILSLDPSRLDIRSTERIDVVTQTCWRMAHLEAKRIVAELLLPGQGDVASRGLLSFYLKWTEKTRVRSYFF